MTGFNRRNDAHRLDLDIACEPVTKDILVLPTEALHHVVCFCSFHFNGTLLSLEPQECKTLREFHALCTYSFTDKLLLCPLKELATNPFIFPLKVRPLLDHELLLETLHRSVTNSIGTEEAGVIGYEYLFHGKDFSEGACVLSTRSPKTQERKFRRIITLLN